eukprot:CAMPEP_0202077674 /NCGR_PEP_ID=MMETSP0964-20121228/5502_1 /ASSEMBLY_ACC=CAM_ASM_000500 /TAXON_ID=4773 /ORGANISM="Schizochytrium aggregatum, Strain ATCC28209" /LENGTH=237 /DNA_ID=CAMNT_0048644955 /DNA_START=85 /DNA_END=798 /DNA_ORIENTATION=+
MAEALQSENQQLRDEVSRLRKEVKELKMEREGGPRDASWAAFRGLNPLARQSIVRRQRVRDERKDVCELLAAAKDGDIARIETALERGVPVDAPARWEFSETALMVAAKWGHTRCVEFLIANRAELDMRDDSGETALYKAAEWGRLETAMALVHRGANLDKACKRTKTTPLMIAAKLGHTDVAVGLMQEGASFKARNAFGQDPFEIARAEGHEETVAALEAAKERRRKSKRIDPTML